MPKITDRSNRWTITLNNFTQEELDVLSGMDVEYMIYGLEHLEEGTPHVQGYVVFKSSIRRSTLQRRIPRAHWEVARGTTQENIVYCSKEDKSPFIKGSPPLERSNAAVNAEQLLEKDPLNGNRILANKRTLRGIGMEKEMLLEIKENRLIKPDIVYIHGSSGSGKSYWALRQGIIKYGIENVSTLRFDKNGFAHCSDPQAKCLVLMEFRPSCIDAATFLEFTDGYGMHLNVKHGSIYIRPECIYICSILPPQEIYKEEINKQFMRRITRVVDKDIDPYVDQPDYSDEDGSTIECPSD